LHASSDHLKRLKIYKVLLLIEANTRFINDCIQQGCIFITKDLFANGFWLKNSLKPKFEKSDKRFESFWGLMTLAWFLTNWLDLFKKD